MKPTKEEIKFALVMGFITAGIISFTLVSVNLGFSHLFFFFWARSWLIAGSIAFLSILFISPRVRKFIYRK